MAGVDTFQWRRRRSIERHTSKETLPEAVRLVIEQLNERLVRVEAIHAALLEEAKRTVKGAA